MDDSTILTDEEIELLNKCLYPRYHKSKKIKEENKNETIVEVIDTYTNRQNAIFRWKIKKINRTYKIQKNICKSYIANERPRYKGKFIKTSMTFVPVTELEKMSYY